MTDEAEPQQEWATHEPPWLHQLHPDLVDKADTLVDKLNRAAIPACLAGPDWRQVDLIDEHDDEPARIVARQPGPWPCQLPEPQVCEDCGHEEPNQLRMAVHRYSHTKRAAGEARAAEKRAARRTAGKPKPGARKQKRRRR